MPAPNLSCAAIGTQQATESLSRFDNFGGIGQRIQWLDQLIAKPLMTTIHVMMIEVLTVSISRRIFAEQDQSVQAFRLESTEEPLQMRVHVGGTHWQTNRLDSLVA